MNFNFKISSNLFEIEFDHSDVAERSGVNLRALLSPVVEDLTGPPVEAEIKVGELLTPGPGEREAAD